MKWLREYNGLGSTTVACLMCCWTNREWCAGGNAMQGTPSLLAAHNLGLSKWTAFHTRDSTSLYLSLFTIIWSGINSWCLMPCQSKMLVKSCFILAIPVRNSVTVVTCTWRMRFIFGKHQITSTVTIFQRMSELLYAVLTSLLLILIVLWAVTILSMKCWITSSFVCHTLSKESEHFQCLFPNQWQNLFLTCCSRQSIYPFIICVMQLTHNPAGHASH